MRRMIRVASHSLLCLALTALCGAADKPSDKKAAPSSVDSGTFTIVVGGQKVATETFRVEQRSDGSTLSSELKTEDASQNKAVQNAEMTMLPNGLLKKYTWKEVT